MNTGQFHLHAYSGKENGLMIIGDAETLNELGRQLLEVNVGDTTGISSDWPKQVISIETNNPFTDRNDYQVSIHLFNGTLNNSLFKKSKGSSSLIVTVVTALLAIVGVFTVITQLIPWFFNR